MPGPRPAWPREHRRRHENREESTEPQTPSVYSHSVYSHNGFMLSSNQRFGLIFLFAAPSHKHARVTPHSLDGPWPKMFQLLFFAHPSLACARWEKRLDPVGPHCQERPTRTRDPMALCCRGAARRYGEGPIRHGPESPRARRLHIRSTRLLRLPRLAWPGRAPLRSRCFDRSLPQPDRMGHLTHGCFV